MRSSAWCSPSSASSLAGITGNPRWDAMGSIAIGLLLVVIAIVLAWEMKGLLIGESADPAMEQRIVAAMTGAPRAVRRLIHLRTEHLGPDELLVGAKLEFDAALDRAGAGRGDRRRPRPACARAVPEARVMYLEPDVHDPERAAVAS